MRRRAKLTGRVDLPLNSIDLDLQWRDDQVRLTRFRLDTPSSLPASADVHLLLEEAGIIQIAHAGTLGDPTPPKPDYFSDFPYSSLLAQVLVTDTTDQPGRLLASSRKFRVNTDPVEQSSESLIAIAIDELGEIPWQLTIDDDEGPLIRLNRRLQHLAGLITTDATSQALFFPPVLERIVSFICEQSDASTEWVEQWRVFLADLGVPAHLLSEDSVEEAVREATTQWCKRMGLVSRIEASAGD